MEDKYGNEIPLNKACFNYTAGLIKEYFMGTALQNQALLYAAFLSTTDILVNSDYDPIIEKPYHQWGNYSVEEIYKMFTQMVVLRKEKLRRLAIENKRNSNRAA